MMMHTQPFYGSFTPFFFLLHGVGMIALALGLTLFFVYAIKTFSHAQLKKWATILTIVGFAGCLLSVPLILQSRGHIPGGIRNSVSDDFKSTQHRGMMGSGFKNSKDLSMNGMTMMLQGLSGASFDSAFVNMMIPHHQGAIDMAELALKNAKHPELKKLATEIIAAQNKEIELMKTWQTTWSASN